MLGWTNDLLLELKDSVQRAIECLHAAEAASGLVFTGGTKGELFEQAFLKEFIRSGWRKGNTKTEPDVVCIYDASLSFEVKTGTRYYSKNSPATFWRTIPGPGKIYYPSHLFVSSSFFWRFGAVEEASWRRGGQRALSITSTQLDRLALVDLYLLTEDSM